MKLPLRKRASALSGRGERDPVHRPLDTAPRLEADLGGPPEGPRPLSAESPAWGREPEPTLGSRDFAPEAAPARVSPGMPGAGDDPSRTLVAASAGARSPAASGGTTKGAATFAVAANRRLWRKESRRQSYAGEVIKLYRSAYTPTQPKRTFESLSGRLPEIRRIVQALEEERAHVVLAGEPGIGKTSLANGIGDLARQAGYLVLSLTCTAELTLAPMLRAVWRDLTTVVAQAPAGDVMLQKLGAANGGALQGEGPTATAQAMDVFRRLADTQVMLILDDYDRVESGTFRRQMEELMKATADEGLPVQFLLLGAAEDPRDLLLAATHAPGSAVFMTLGALDADGIAEAIARGERLTGIEFRDEVRRAVAFFSQGIPYVAQSLALLCVRHAVKRHSLEVDDSDLGCAIRECVERIDPHLNELYRRLTRSRHGAWAKEVLRLAAGTPCGEDGLFSVPALRAQAARETGRSLSELSLHAALSRLASRQYGEVLRKVPATVGPAYRFRSSLMRSVVLLQAQRDPSAPVDELPLRDDGPVAIAADEATQSAPPADATRLSAY